MIRKYDPGDEDDVINVWRKSSAQAHPFLTESFQNREEENIRKIYLPSTATWVCEIEEKIVGFISMIKNEIGALFVLPELIGTGIGSELISHVNNSFKNLTVRVFEKNDIGRNFYDKKGFKIITQEIHEDSGEVMLFMELRQ